VIARGTCIHTDKQTAFQKPGSSVLKVFVNPSVSRWIFFITAIFSHVNYVCVNAKLEE
jgi:hypothetical protein